jgi:hypothetical protein
MIYIRSGFGVDGVDGGSTGIVTSGISPESELSAKRAN